MPTPPSLSVSIVCCNNQQTIGRTLESVAPIATEIIVLDSGSTDNTMSILAHFDTRIIDQPWLGHVKQKQAALDRCTGDWVLHMDSDESLDDDLQNDIRTSISDAPEQTHGFTVNRQVFFAGRLLQHAWQPEWRLRLVRRESARWTGTDPHDRLELTRGTSEKLKGVMRHDTMPSLSEFLRRQVEHARVSAEANSTKTSIPRLITSPLGAWSRQMLIKQAWRDGWRGWCAASASAISAAMKHMILLEHQRLGAERAKSD